MSLLGKCIIVAGKTGSGKSFWVKESLLSPWLAVGGNAFVYDINNEHGFPEPPLPEDFVLQVESARKSLIFFEEATIFFSHKQGDSRELRNLLVRKRHRQNVIVFVFHSIRKIPAYVLDFCDIFVLKKTNDTPSFVEKKLKGYDNLLYAYDEVRKDGDKYCTRIIDMLN